MKNLFSLLFIISILILSVFSCNKCDEVVWYQDADLDGLGNANVTITACEKPEGFVGNSDDEDDDCNLKNWYYDDDGDGYGTNDSIIISCKDIPNFVLNNDDPDDGDPTLTPENVWQGNKLDFVKPNGANWKLAENQDRITDNVWITRGESNGIFNLITDSTFTTISPNNTLWAFGNTSSINSLNFGTWLSKVDGCTSCLIDIPMVIHLTLDDIYIDIKFKSYVNDADGYGGFSYQRSTKKY